MKIAFFPYNGNSIEAFDILGENHELVAFVDDSEIYKGKSYSGIPIVNRERVKQFEGEVNWIAAPGSPTSFLDRKEVIDGLNIKSAEYTKVISDRAFVGGNVKLGYNLIIMAGCVLTSNAIIGNHIVILPHSIIHHDSVIGDYTIIGSNVTIAGGVRIEDNVYIGSGSSIKNGIKIGSGALIGIGSNVIQDVAPGEVVGGNPAKKLNIKK